MPIYEYHCDGCGTEFEVQQRISAPPGAVCPGCGSDRVRRLISSTSFQLKGSGWYVTDYAGKKPPSRSDSFRSGEAKGSGCASADSCGTACGKASAGSGDDD